MPSRVLAAAATRKKVTAVVAEEAPVEVAAPVGKATKKAARPARKAAVALVENLAHRSILSW